MITYIVLKTELIHVGVRQIPTNLFTKKKKKKRSITATFLIFFLGIVRFNYMSCVVFLVKRDLNPDL